MYPSQSFPLHHAMMEWFHHMCHNPPFLSHCGNTVLLSSSYYSVRFQHPRIRQRLMVFNDDRKSHVLPLEGSDLIGPAGGTRQPLSAYSCTCQLHRSTCSTCPALPTRHASLPAPAPALPQPSPAPVHSELPRYYAQRALFKQANFLWAQIGRGWEGQASDWHYPCHNIFVWPLPCLMSEDFEGAVVQ